MVTPQIRYPASDRQKISNIPDMTIHTQPEVIKGSNFYEIIAEMPGLASQSDIQANYDPNTQSVRIFTSGPRKYDINVRISDIQDGNIKIDQIEYLNGIYELEYQNNFDIFDALNFVNISELFCYLINN